MQVQKEEMRVQIVEAARHEFHLRGFRGASMRTIAKKSNTTIGNLYNYYKSKELLFDAVMGDLPEVLKKMLFNHREAFEEATKQKYTFQQLVEQLEEQLPEAFLLKAILSQEFIILMEGAEGTKYEGYKEEFLEYCKEHMKEHLPGEENRFLAEEIASSFLSVLIYIANHMTSLEEGIKGLTGYIEILIAGIMGVSQLHSET